MKNVTFYRIWESRGVMIGWTLLVWDDKIKNADVVHPTRISDKDWEYILSVPTERVQEVLKWFIF